MAITVVVIHNKTPSCIGQGHKVIFKLRKKVLKKLHNKSPSYIKQDHKIISESYIKVHKRLHNKIVDRYDINH